MRGLVIEARSGVSRKKCGVLGRGGAGTVRAAFGCADGNQRVVLGGFPYTRRVATSNANAGSMGQRAPCAANEAHLVWLGTRRPIDLTQSRRSQEDASMQGKRCGGRVKGSQGTPKMEKDGRLVVSPNARTPLSCPSLVCPCLPCLLHACCIAFAATLSACKTVQKRPRWQCATPGSAQRPVWG